MLSISLVKSLLVTRILFRVFFILLIVGTWLAPPMLHAQSGNSANSGQRTLEISLPDSVELNNPFVLSVSTTDLNGEIIIKGDNFINHGKLGYSSSKSLINGVFSERNITQFQLTPTLLGYQSISVSVGSVKKNVTIKVITTGKNQRTPNSSTSPTPRQSPSTGILANRSYSDLVKVKNIIKKRKLYINEITELTTIIYTAVTIRNPSLLNRFNQSCYNIIPMEKFNRNNRNITIDGIPYYQTTIMKHLLYPVKAGKCEIEKIGFRVAVTPDQGFGFIHNNELITINAAPITLQVMDYPAKDRSGKTRPTDFNYQYGDFSLNFQLAEDRLVENEPLLLTVSISGNGNFYTLGEPIFTELSPLLNISKQGISDQYSANKNTLTGKKFYRYYLTYSGNGGQTPASEISLPKIELSYFSDRKRIYVRETEPLPSLPLVIASPSVNENRNSTLTVDPLTPPSSWYPPIYDLSDLKEQDISFTKRHDYAWSIIGWYHFAGIFALSGLSLMIITGIQISSFPIKKLKQKLVKSGNIISNKKDRQSNQAEKISSNNLSRATVEKNQDILSKKFSHELTKAKKNLSLISAQKNNLKNLSKSVEKVLSKLLHTLYVEHSFQSEEKKIIFPKIISVDVTNATRKSKEYWSILHTILSLVVRNYLKVTDSESLIKFLKNARTENFSTISNISNTSWLLEVEKKLTLYEEHMYRNNNKLHNKKIDIVTKKPNLDKVIDLNIGELYNEGNILLKLLQKLSSQPSKNSID